MLEVLTQIVLFLLLLLIGAIMLTAIRASYTVQKVQEFEHEFGVIFMYYLIPKRLYEKKISTNPTG